MCLGVTGWNWLWGRENNTALLVLTRSDVLMPCMQLCSYHTCGCSVNYFRFLFSNNFKPFLYWRIYYLSDYSSLLFFLTRWDLPFQCVLFDALLTLPNLEGELIALLPWLIIFLSHHSLKFCILFKPDHWVFLPCHWQNSKRCWADYSSLWCFLENVPIHSLLILCIFSLDG